VVSKLRALRIGNNTPLARDPFLVAPIGWVASSVLWVMGDVEHLALAW
jgi:hypothetical protein